MNSHNIPFITTPARMIAVKQLSSLGGDTRAMSSRSSQTSRPVSRRTLLAGSVVAAGALTLAACGSSSSSSSSNKSTTIEMWDYLGQGVSNTAMNAAVKAFEAANSGITVKRTSFAYADLAKSIVQGGIGGSIPDVAVVDVVDNQNFAALKLLKDLTQSEGTRAKEFFDGPWKSTQLEGKTYGLPLNSNNLALYYNKTLLSAAGVKPPTTWDELRAVAKAVTKDGVTGLAVSAIKNEQGTFQILPFVWQTGGDLDTYATSGAEALEFLRSLIDDGSMSSAVTNYSQEDARTQFTSGKVAMMSNGPWELQNLKDLGFEWGVAPLPKGRAAATGLGGENVVVFDQAKAPDAAVTLLKYLTGTDGAKVYCDGSGQLSARPDLQGKLMSASDPGLKVFEDQLSIARARAYGKDYAKVSEAIQLSIQEALTGAKTAQAAAADAAKSLEPLLKASR